MKDLKKLAMLGNVAKAMLEEAKKSEASKKAGLDLKADLKNVVSAENGKKIAQDIIIAHKAKVDSIKEMLNSEEASFIKMAAKESDPGKKVAKATGKAKKTLGKLGDLLPVKVKNEYIGYKHWCMNWYYIGNMAISAPVPVIKAMLKYNWIYDLLKANAMVTTYTQGRVGANYAQVHKQLTYLVEEMCDMVLYDLLHPDEVVITQNMIPAEILQAMGIRNMVPELVAVVLPKTDQFAGVPYLDAAEEKGLGVDSCGLPRFTTGVALMNQTLPGRAIIATNLPCDGGLASYETIQQSLGNVPIYRLNVPYDFRNDDSQDSFADDLKGMVQFLEENTGKTMDWDKLREICKSYNELIEIETERWELTKLDNPPLTNEAIWFPHYWGFNAAAMGPKLVKHHRELFEMAREAYAKGIPAQQGMKYRTIVWNPPPSGYGHLWNWLERCWGVGSVMDLETYGNMEFIDTTSPETMLKGLGRRYMWATMAKHTRGPAENMLGDLKRVIQDFKPDFILYPAHLGCKNSMSLESTMKDECKKMNIPFCIFRYELVDNRVSSRQQMRNDISKFMTEVMNATPLDASLLQVDDSEVGRW